MKMANQSQSRKSLIYRMVNTYRQTSKIEKYIKNIIKQRFLRTCQNEKYGYFEKYGMYTRQRTYVLVRLKGTDKSNKIKVFTYFSG